MSVAGYCLLKIRVLKIFSRIVGAWYWKSEILSTVPRTCQREDIWPIRAWTAASKVCLQQVPPLFPPPHATAWLADIFPLESRFLPFSPTAGPGPRLHDFTLVSPTHKKILKTLGYIIYVRDEEYLNRLNMLSKKTPSVFSCIRNCVIITTKRWAKVGGATMRQDNQRIIHVNLIRKNSS